MAQEFARALLASLALARTKAPRHAAAPQWPAARAWLVRRRR
jgi:hypothetical protein